MDGVHAQGQGHCPFPWGLVLLGVGSLPFPCFFLLVTLVDAIFFVALIWGQASFCFFLTAGCVGCTHLEAGQSRIPDDMRWREVAY